MTEHDQLHAALIRHAERLRATRTSALFDADPDRAARYTRAAAGITLDFSKNLLDDDAARTLRALADVRALGARIADMFAGAPLNCTEERAVLHVALRAPAGQTLQATGIEVSGEVAAAKRRMSELVAAVHDGTWRGHGGHAMTDVVNIGIGGSHLGPQLACTALREDGLGKVRVHFVSNVDGGDIAATLASLDPARTLFIIASKSFTTPETRLNAETAAQWLRAAGIDGAGLAAHFIAITSRPERAAAFGIDPAHVLPMWDWVGGRYSLWSAIGLPIAFAIGMGGFEAMLAGAAAMDAHFRSAAWTDNLPVLLALVGIWNTNYLGAESFAVVPYEERLQHLPAYLQQLEMESNGKRVTLDNTLVAGETAPILWGGLGTNVQHAFFQLLHQGTRLIPVDFVLPLTNPRSPPGHHDMLVANCLAQAEALMGGRTADSLRGHAPSPAGIDLPLHRSTPGNQPSNLLLLESLTPATLGALLALYEHKTFVQGVIWRINSFDQWGVELGKELAQALLDEIAGGQVGAHHDGSTRAALTRYLALRAR